MNASRLSLVLLPLAAVLTAAYFLTGSDDPSPDAVTSIAPGWTPGADSKASSGALEAPELLATQDTAQDSDAATRQLSAAARRLRVQVLADASLAADPELRVVAVPAEALSGVSPTEALTNPETKVLDRAPVGSDGWAELELPAAASDLRLLLDGAYLFAEPLTIGQEDRELTLNARLGGRVDVRLGSSVGAPFTGEVQLTGGNWGGRGRGGWSSRELQVDAPGVISFRGVDAERTWSLQPKLEDRYARSLVGIEIEPGHTTTLELDVTPGASVSGVVTGADGEPLEGVEVSRGGGMAWMGGGSRREVTTGPDGRFELRGLAPGVFEIEARQEGLRDASSGELEVSEGETRSGLELVLEQGLVIAGQVLGTEAEPVAGAEVSVERRVQRNWGGWGGSRVSRQGSDTTDDQGRFRISGLEEGSYTVRASFQVAEDAPKSRGQAKEIAAGSETVLLELAGPLTFEGRVVDDLGEPVTAFQIEVDDVEQGGPTERADFEDAEGRFTFARAGAGAWEVSVDAQGFYHPEARELRLPSDGTEMVLTVQRIASVSGRVVDPSGAPVVGASVRGDSGGGGGWGGWGRPSGPRTETGEDGSFVLEQVAPGSLVLSASLEGWADSEGLALDLAPGDQREGVALTLRVGGRIEGLVLTPEGDPRAGERVTWGSNAMGFGSNGEATSDAAGRFVFDHVTPGSWTVSAVPSYQELADGMQTRGRSSFTEVMGNLISETVEVLDGETTEVWLGGEPRQPVRIFGVVTRAGEALADAEVIGVSESSAVFEGMKTARTDESGAYEIVLDNPGPHTISARLGSVGVAEFLEVPRQEELRLDLAIPLGRIEGRVSEPDGSAADGIRLSIQRQDGLGRMRWSGDQNSTDSDGRYAFEDLQPGVYTVRANTSGWGAGGNERFGTLLVADIEVGEDEVVSGVDFELQTAGTVTGLVVDAGGSPLQGASVYFRDASGRAVQRVSQTVSDAAGRFDKTGLAPGTYTVSARGDNQAAGDSVTVRVASGETADVRISLEAATMMLVELQDAEGEARRARVQVFDEDDREVGDLMTLESMRSMFNQGSSMEQRVGPFPPGRYTVRATLSDGRSEERKVRLRGRDEERRVRLKLDD